MPLDSDVSNADAQLYVEFHEYTGQDKDYHGFDFVKIMVPGDKTQVYDQPVKDEHKARFPRQWLHYQMTKAGGEGVAIGTPLDQWNKDQPDIFGENQMLELAILKFQTVEQVATASDAQLQRIGMGGAGLREKARSYLGNRNRSASETELAETKSQLAALQAQMTQMMAMMQPPAVNRGGRPRKVADDGKLDADPRDAGHG